MMNTVSRYATLTVIASSVTSTINAETIYGPPKPIGAGFLRDYIVFDDDDVPVEIGVELDEVLMDLSTMPTEASDGQYDIIDATTGDVGWFCCGHEVELTSVYQDDRADDTIPVKHFVANWNPQGHVPVGLFDVPHWDLHFYTVSSAKRRSIQTPATLDDTCDRLQNVIPDLIIPTTCSDLDLLNKPIPADQVPPSHVCPFEGATVEPAMGLHL